MAENSGIRLELANAMAFLHCEILGRTETKEFIKTGGKIAHIFDSDVLVASIEPFAMGPAPNFVDDGSAPDSFPRNTGGWGYGQLLPRQRKSDLLNPTLQKLLEDRHAWYTTKILTGACVDVAKAIHGSILQFPKHKNTTTKIFDSIVNKATETKTQSKSNAEIQHLRQTKALTENLLERNAPAEIIYDFLSRRMEGLFLSFADGRSRAARSYQNLIEFKKTNKLECYKRQRIFDGELSEIVLGGDFLRVDAVAAEFLEPFWHERLRAKKHRGKAGLRIEEDVEALVELTQVNRQLIYLDRNKNKKRCVFVTGDKSLVHATYGISKSEIDRKLKVFVRKKIHFGDLDQEQGNDLFVALQGYFGISEDKDKNGISGWFENFSHHYIRHFWAVAGEELIEKQLTKKAGGANKVEDNKLTDKSDGMTEEMTEDFFHGYFAAAGERLFLSRKNVEERVLKGEPYDRSQLQRVDPDSVLREWTRLTASRLEGSRFNDNARTEFKSIVEGKEIQGANILKVFEEMGHRQRDRAMVDLSEFGADLLFLSAHNVSVLPDLFLGPLPETNKIFGHLAKRAYQTLDMKKDENQSLRSFWNDFQNIRKDCFKPEISNEKAFDDRQKSHIKFLVLAAAFASNEKWAAAHGHVLRALNVLNRSGNSQFEFNGEIPVKAVSDKKGRSFLSGREANYLAAITTRMRALDVETDLKLARYYLATANSKILIDQDRLEELDSEFFAARHSNENWSINITEYFIERCNSRVKDETHFSDLVVSYDLCRDNGSEEIWFFKNQIDYRLSYPLTCDAIAFNILQYALIAERWASSDQFLEMDLVHRALSWLNARASNTSEYAEPNLVKLYRLAVPLCLPSLTNASPNGKIYFERFRDRDEIDALADIILSSKPDRGNSGRNLQRPEYDRWRVEQIFEKVRAKLEFDVPAQN